MKAFSNSLLVAFASTVTSFHVAQANPKPPQKVAAFETGIYTTAEGKVQVAVQKETTSPVVVRLINEKGEDVFMQRIGSHQSSACLRLDVSNLSDGLYQVVVSNGVETSTKEVALSTKQPTITPRLIAIR